MPTESVNIDGPMDLVADMIKAAVYDIQRGPGLGKHYESAMTFLSDAGLLDTVQARLRAHATQGICTSVGGSVATASGVQSHISMERSL